MPPPLCPFGTLTPRTPSALCHSCPLSSIYLSRWTPAGPSPACPAAHTATLSSAQPQGPPTPTPPLLHFNTHTGDLGPGSAFAVLAPIQMLHWEEVRCPPPPHTPHADPVSHLASGLPPHIPHTQCRRGRQALEGGGVCLDKWHLVGAPGEGLVGAPPFFLGSSLGQLPLCLWGLPPSSFL